MASHREGPWEIGTVYANCEDIEDGMGVSICSTTDHADSGLSEEVRKANARLIAAAPDLFTALEDVVEMAQEWADGKSRSHPDHERVAAARAALKKAVTRG